MDNYEDDVDRIRGCGQCGQLLLIIPTDMHSGRPDGIAADIGFPRNPRTYYYYYCLKNLESVPVALRITHPYPLSCIISISCPPPLLFSHFRYHSLRYHLKFEDRDRYDMQKSRK